MVEAITVGATGGKMHQLWSQFEQDLGLSSFSLKYEELDKHDSITHSLHNLQNICLYDKFQAYMVHRNEIWTLGLRGNGMSAFLLK